MSKPKTTPPEVFFLPWDRRSELPQLLRAAKAEEIARAGEFAAIKMHFGEQGNDGYIRPEYVRPVIELMQHAQARPFLTDTNTIYSGPRKDALGHLQVAADHGFSLEAMGVPVIIADGLRGTDAEAIPVKGTHFQQVHIGTGILRAHAMMVLSHFKGHILAGFGGALKNLGMGCGSRKGKFEMHSSMPPQIDADTCISCGACVTACGHSALTMSGSVPVLQQQNCVGCGECAVICPVGAITIASFDASALMQERFVEYAAGAVAGKRCFYVNFLNHITPNCDCMSRGEHCIAPDIGIVASSDPVAIDQASLDLVIARSGDVFRKERPNIDATVQLAHAEQMGLGSRTYTLVNL